ncbi:hypothetical protein GCM10022252_73740 [Streptosporangium oxazolinicum]|uniref:AB hydrolase-1 domain-containing protein n=2 Tax=Streptosporangium oxazolinicum TaxID=909287 RepID=A0ABP8BJS7_9ACTN
MTRCTVERVTETVSLAYDVDGSGPLLVAIHGMTEDRHLWDLVPLAERFRTLRVDLRGHGESPHATPYDPLTMAGDVHALLGALGLEQPPLVVGHSQGGMVATAYTSRQLRGAGGDHHRYRVLQRHRVRPAASAGPPGPHLDIEGVPGPSTAPGSTRPIRPGERPGVGGFTAQKSSATSSVLAAPRTRGRIDDHDRRQTARRRRGRVHRGGPLK